MNTSKFKFNFFNSFSLFTIFIYVVSVLTGPLRLPDREYFSLLAKIDDISLELYDYERDLQICNDFQIDFPSTKQEYILNKLLIAEAININLNVTNEEIKEYLLKNKLASLIIDSKSKTYGFDKMNLLKQIKDFLIVQKMKKKLNLDFVMLPVNYSADIRMKIYSYDFDEQYNEYLKEINVEEIYKMPDVCYKDLARVEYFDIPIESNLSDALLKEKAKKYYQDAYSTPSCCTPDRRSATVYALSNKELEDQFIQDLKRNQDMSAYLPYVQAVTHYEVYSNNYYNDLIFSLDKEGDYVNLGYGQYIVLNKIFKGEKLPYEFCEDDIIENFLIRDELLALEQNILQTEINDLFNLKQDSEKHLIWLDSKYIDPFHTKIHENIFVNYRNAGFIKLYNLNNNTLRMNQVVRVYRSEYVKNYKESLTFSSEEIKSKAQYFYAQELASSYQNLSNLDQADIETVYFKGEKFQYEDKLIDAIFNTQPKMINSYLDLKKNLIYVFQVERKFTNWTEDDFKQRVEEEAKRYITIMPIMKKHSLKSYKYSLYDIATSSI